MAGAYYNEIDPVAAEWLRRLVAAGLIPAGEVDERDIRDVAPDDLRGFVQCHFFAGIGIWPHALRRAGWPDDRPIWSGSCPCQPFSDAGAGEGFADERHLWPHWQWLIAHRQPPAVVGEQVASKDGLGWLDLVSADMEGAGYAFGAADLCAAGFGLDWRSTAWREWLQRAVWDCPDPMVAGWLRHFAEWADKSLIVGGQHIRQRLYFVAFRLADLARGGRGIGWDDEAWSRGGRHPDRSRDRDGRVGDSQSFQGGPPGLGNQGSGRAGGAEPAEHGDSERLGQPAGPRQQGREIEGPEGDSRDQARVRGLDDRRDLGGPWAGQADELRAPFDWIICRDGFWRPVESGTAPLAHAVAGRVAKLRSYGNGLDAETATGFSEIVTDIWEALVEP